jgi:tetratricopeptide (TPR) repeat protein
VRERLEVAPKILRLAEELGDRDMVFRAHHLRLTALLELGDIAGVDSEIEALDLIASELRQPLYRWQTGALHAMRAQLSGHFEEGEQLAQEALMHGQWGEHDGPFNVFSAQLSQLYWAWGRMAELEEATRDFAEGFPNIPAWRACLALVYNEERREDETRAELERVMPHGFADFPRDAQWTTCILLCAWAAAFVRDTARAAKLYELAIPRADVWTVTSSGAICIGPLSLAIGPLAATLGKWDEATEHFERTIELCDAVGAQHFVGRALTDRAEMLLARDAPGDAARASELAARSLALSEKLGMRKQAERAAALRERAEAALSAASRSR